MSRFFSRLLAVWLVLAGPAAGVAKAQGCLSPGDARQAVASGEAASLSQIRGGIPGQVLSAQLCRAGGGLVYLVSVLGEGGQVQRLQVDARTGAVVGR